MDTPIYIHLIFRYSIHKWYRSIKYIRICISNVNIKGGFFSFLVQASLQWETGLIINDILLSVSIRKCNFGGDIKFSNLQNIFGCCSNFFPLLDLPTVEELMKPMKINSFGVSGFDLQPVRYEFFGMNCTVCLFIALSLKNFRVICSS